MIVFLDFDGVLSPEGSEEALFSRKQLLWQILRACPNVQVVFSTSWREMFSFAELVHLVTTGGGEDLPSRFIGATPIIAPEPNSGNYRCREIECLTWLAQNDRARQQWLALDDTGQWYSQPCPHLYRTNPETGMTDTDVPKIIDRIKNAQVG